MRRTITAIAILVIFVMGIVPVFAADSCCPPKGTPAKVKAKAIKPNAACPTGDKCDMKGKKDGAKCPYMGTGKTPPPGATCPMTGSKAGKVVKKPAHKKAVSAICPIMGTKIPDISKAVGKSVYKGKTYYFCCAGCKPMFDKNPEKYIHKSAKK